MEPVREIYIDSLFVLNAAADLIWLWAAARLAGLKVRPWRLVLGALLGASLSVWAQFPTGAWLTTLPGLFVGSAAFLAAAILPCRRYQFLRAGGYLVLSGAAMAGTATLMNQAGGELGTLPDSSPMLVAVGLILTVLGIRRLIDAVRVRAQLKQGLYRLRVRVGGDSVEITSLMDTGNSSRDPLSGTPVVVVEANALGTILPAAMLNACADFVTTVADLPPAWAVRCRLIPFRAVGKSLGMLLAFAPDEVAVLAPQSRHWQSCCALIAVQSDPLHGDGAYRALLTPAMLPDATPEPGIA